MKYIGIDFHKSYSIITEKDDTGKTLRQFRLNNDLSSLTNYLDQLDNRSSKIALEATGSWYYFYELIEGKNFDLTLAHPLKTKAIASAKIKTDKIDSAMLADLLRADLLPKSYIPNRETRDAKEILRYRASLVCLRSGIKNRVHAILSKNGLMPGFSDLFGKAGLEYLKGLELRESYQIALHGYLGLVEVLNKLIKEVTEEIKKLTEQDEEALLLTSIPGIKYYSACLIKSEIGEISRFPYPEKLCSFGGLVPSVHSSGGKTKYGGITRQGSKWLRWILAQVAIHAAKGTVRFGRLYSRVRKKHGSNAAKIAVARELLRTIYFMLKKKEAFKDSSIRTEEKVPAISLGS